MQIVPEFIRNRFNRTAPGLDVNSLSEQDMWNLFNIYISDDQHLAKLVEESGGSGAGTVGTRLNRYQQLLSYDVSKNNISSGQLKRLIDLCWQMYDYDPLIRQGVDSRALYTFGQGITVGCRRKGPWGKQLARIVDSFWRDPCNFRRFTSTSALISLDVQLQLEGNVPLFIWREGEMLQVRPLKTVWLESFVQSDYNGNTPSAKTVGYILNLEGDSAIYGGGLNDTQYISMHGRQMGRTHTRVAYADIDADPEELEGLVGDIPIDYNGRIAHIKAWGRPWSGLGTTPILPALDPAQRYGGFLEDWSVVQGLFRTFVLSIASKGGNKGVQDIAKKFRDSNFSNSYNPALSSSDYNETNKSGSPLAHTVYTGLLGNGQAGTRIEAIKTAGATEGPEKARELKLMLCSAFGLPETMFGDAKVGNHATSHVLERTVDLRAQANQTLWADFIESILKYVIRDSIYGGQADDSVDPYVSFPPIVEHVLKEHVESIVTGYEAGLLPNSVATRELLQALHIQDSEEILHDMYGIDEVYGKARDAVDIAKGKIDLKKVQIQVDAMKENAKLMASRPAPSPNGNNSGNSGSNGRNNGASGANRSSGSNAR